MSSAASASSSLGLDYQKRCEGRLAEWVKFCREEYNLDPLHAKLIASVLIPSEYKPIWLIVETSNAPFWQHLSYYMELLGLHRILNLAGLRTTRPRYANRQVDEWMQARNKQPRIFIDTYFENPNCWQGVLRRHGYWHIASECIRVRITVPFTAPRLKTPETHMAGALNLAVDPTHRRLFPVPVRLPDVVMEFIELLPRLNPELSDPMALHENMMLVPSSHAVLHGRTELIEEDWSMLKEFLRGGVRYWTRRMLMAFRRREMLKHEDLAIDTGFSDEIVRQQTRRLEGAGILRRSKYRGRRYAPTEDGLKVVRMITSNVKCRDS
jgi:hypothetical protein